MSKHTINWVNDHTQICDRLNETGFQKPLEAILEMIFFTKGAK